MFDLSEEANWFDGFIPNFEQHLSHFKGVKCHFVEIGSFEGRSAIWMLQNILTHPESTLTCIDSDVHKTAEKLYKNMSRFPGKVNVIIESSAVVLPTFVGKYCFDFIYVDGQHCGYMPLHDMVLSHSLLHLHGIMAIDDYLAEHSNIYGIFDVKTCVDAFLSVYGPNYEELPSNFGGYQKWLRKIAC